MTNLDLDGDEMWGIVPATYDGTKETGQNWLELWTTGVHTTVLGSVYEMGRKSGLGASVDSAFLTTMTFEEIAEHPGGAPHKD